MPLALGHPPKYAMADFYVCDMKGPGAEPDLCNLSSLISEQVVLAAIYGDYGSLGVV